MAKRSGTDVPSKRNTDLVSVIVGEILLRHEFVITRNPLYVELIGSLQYFLSIRGKIVHAHEFMAQLTGKIYEAAYAKTKHLRPDTLGRIASTGVSKSSERTEMGLIMSSEEAYGDEDDGITVLRELAAIVLAAAIWDVITENIQERPITQDEAARLLPGLFPAAK
jgi:hypothetical protein